jgi:hypothetical protein
MVISTKYEHIDNIKSLFFRYWSDYDKTVAKILACTNSYYVTKGDKKALKEEKSPLERNHLRYLL